jgi:hypothetical protein
VSASPMVLMSRAIRGVLEAHAHAPHTLREIPDQALNEFRQIMHAFAADIAAELDRRRAIRTREAMEE